jgi:hypothetical protein
MAGSNGLPDRPASVVRNLAAAIAALMKCYRRGAIPPAGPPSDPFDDPFDGREEDDNHVYLWLDLPARLGPDVDINVHGTMLMIRLTKARRAL